MMFSHVRSYIMCIQFQIKLQFLIAITSHHVDSPESEETKN